MANTSVDHLGSNLQIDKELEARDNLFENLQKAQALSQLAAISDNFAALQPVVIYNYMWAISDFIDEACCAFDEIT